MNTKLGPLIVICLFLYSCSLPITKTESGETRPLLAIKGSPKNSILYVDGLMAGKTKNFNGKPQALLIEPGTHLVEIKSSTGKTIFSQKLFVESGVKTITINENNN